MWNSLWKNTKIIKHELFHCLWTFPKTAPGCSVVLLNKSRAWTLTRRCTIFPQFCFLINMRWGLPEVLHIHLVALPQDCSFFPSRFMGKVGRASQVFLGECRVCLWKDWPGSTRSWVWGPLNKARAKLGVEEGSLPSLPSWGQCVQVSTEAQLWAPL